MSFVGTTIYGFCGGYFGRDDYEDKIIIFEGATWIVCRYVDRDEVACANFRNEAEKVECVSEWRNKETS